MFYLGIDLGASFIKGAVLDLEGRCLREIRRAPFPGFIPGLHPSFREVHPGEILRAVGDMLDELLPLAPGCAGIVMCSQMHGLILVRGEGEPLSNFISWQDQRALMAHPSGGGSFFDHLRGRLSENIRRRLGNELRPGLPIASLFWLAEQSSLPEKAIPVSLPDFVLARLCSVRPSMETTQGASQGALNLETSEWDSETLALAGLDGLCWPPLRPNGEVLGYLGSASIPCYTPVGDQQCALLGAFLREGELSLNIATGAQVSLLSPELTFGDYQTRPFPGGRFLKTVTHIPAGRSLNLLIRLLSELSSAEGHKTGDPWEYIERAVGAVGETDLRMNLAFFASPFGQTGEISHMTEANLTVGHLFRAAYENISGNFFRAALRLSPGEEWRRIVFSGGIGRKLEVLRAIITAQFRKPARLCSSSEDTLLGLLVLALAFSCHSANGGGVLRVLEQLERLDARGHCWS